MTLRELSCSALKERFGGEPKSLFSLSPKVLVFRELRILVNRAVFSPATMIDLVHPRVPVEARLASSMGSTSTVAIQRFAFRKLPPRGRFLHNVRIEPLPGL